MSSPTMSTYTGPTVASYAPTANGAVWFTTSVATLAFFLRIYSRAMLTRDIGWDDFIMAIGWATSLASSILFTISVNASIQATQDIADLPNALRLTLISVALGIMALFIPKIPVSLLLIRILKPKRWVKILLILLALFGLALGVGGVIIEFIQCNPVPGQWDPTVYHPKCWSPNIQIDYSILTGAFSAFLDFTFAFYPAIVFWDLQIPLNRKVELSIIMGLGAIAGSFGIYKCTLFPTLKNRSAGIAVALYESSRLTMLTGIEANLIINAACIPLTSSAMRALKVRTKDYLSTFNSRNSSSRTSHGRYKEFSEYTVPTLPSQNQSQHPREVYSLSDISVA